MDEVIADACERMLLDSNVVKRMMAQEALELGFWRSIVQHVVDLIDRIRA